MNMQYYLNIEHQVLNDTPSVDACVACRLSLHWGVHVARSWSREMYVAMDRGSKIDLLHRKVLRPMTFSAPLLPISNPGKIHLFKARKKA